MSKIIGLSGYARSGKDTVADILVADHGFIKVAYADVLRDFLYAANPIVEVKRADIPLSVSHPDGTTKKLWTDENTRSTIPVSVTYRLSDVIDKYGWDGYKSTPYAAEIRGLIQRTGTEAGREILGNNVWVDSTFKRMQHGKDYVISDCRFPNEAAAVQVRYGLLWRIKRAGVGPANDHPSETSLDNYIHDYTLENNGTIEDLRKKVNEFLVDSKM